MIDPRRQSPDAHHDDHDAVIRLRPATADDVPFALALVPRLVAMDLPPWRERDAIRASSEQGVREAILRRAGGAAVLVAEDTDGQPLGFVHLEPERDFFSGATRGYVANLAVRSETEGRGVGRALMAAAEAWSRNHGFDVLTLYVFAANERARRFYRELGFQEDSLRLVKPLAGTVDRR